MRFQKDGFTHPSTFTKLISTSRVCPESFKPHMCIELWLSYTVIASEKRDQADVHSHCVGNISLSIPWSAVAYSTIKLYICHSCCTYTITLCSFANNTIRSAVCSTYIISAAKRTFRLLYSLDDLTFLTNSINLMNSTYALSSSFCRAASFAARNRTLDERPRLRRAEIECA